MAFGQDDEDEKFKQMLGGIIGDGPAPYDVTTSMEMPDAPDQSTLSAPYMPQSAAAGLGGYTPPPAAAAPQYLDHVQGHQFGAGDVAMLGGILAALLGGGRHRGDIAGGIAGAYGDALMTNNARADTRNAQIDQFNAQLAAKDDPLARWKADQEAQYRVGSLKARGDELALQRTREQRIADAQAAEDAKDPVEQARLIEEARSKVRLDTKRQENDMEVGTREMLGEILGKQHQKYASPTGGGTGPDGKPLDPSKLLKQKEAQAILDGIEAGTLDPTTGKPKEKPKTPAQIAADNKLDAALAPFEGTEVADESVWKPVASNPTIREKNRLADTAVAQALPALDTMISLREANGGETGWTEGSANVKSQYDVAQAKVEAALGQLKNIGVISPTEAARLQQTVPTMDYRARDLISGLAGDDNLGKLRGARKEFTSLLEGARKSYGLRAKGAPKEQDLGTSDDGAIKFSVDTDKLDKFNKGEGGGFGPGDSTGKPSTETPGGKRLTTVVSPNGKVTKTEEMDDEQRARFQAANWTVR